MEERVALVDGWLAELRATIASPEFEQMTTSQREYMRLEHHWLSSYRDALAQRSSA